MRLELIREDLLVSCLFYLTAYQPFSSHLMQNQVILIKTWF